MKIAAKGTNIPLLFLERRKHARPGILVSKRPKSAVSINSSPPF